jgi:hypothetical protein
MKITLAIAFALLLATAYGFRVRESKDTCYTHSNTEGGCDSTSTDCMSPDFSSMSMIGTTKCANGNTTDSTCFNTHSADGANGSIDEGNCLRSECEPNWTNCVMYNSYNNGTCTSAGACVSYNKNDKTNADGSSAGKLAYFI